MEDETASEGEREGTVPKLKMLIGVISEGEAAQKREGSKAAEGQGCARKACVCVTR